MEEQTTVKLTVPRQDFAGEPLFAPDVDAAANWVQSLPAANTNTLVKLLGQALSDLNRTKLSPETRYGIIELLRPNIDVAVSNLSKRFLNQPLVLPDEPRRMADIADRLLTMTATCYTIVAIETIQQRDAISTANPARLTCQALHRAMLFSGRRILQNFQLHKPLEIYGWQTLHQLYALAENQRLADLPVPEPLTGGDSIKAAYLQVLLLACCKPNQLRQSDMVALYRGLQQWSADATLGTHRTDEALFIVDLGGDQPPLYRALYRDVFGPTCRHIDTAPLVSHLHTLREESGAKPLIIDQNTSMSATILDHLITSLGSMSLRNFKRTSTDSPLWICAGLSSVHYHVCGQRTFEQLIYGDEGSRRSPGKEAENPFMAARGKTDVWQRANPGDYISEARREKGRAVEVSATTKARLLQDEDAELPPNERYPVFRVQLADASPGGYCLEWAADMPADLKGGDIVGLKEEEHKEWVIAVIRWVSRLNNAKTLIGLELLSPRAIAYGARIHQKSGDKMPPMRVLLLPEIKLVGQPQTLITPRTGFKERQKVTLGNSKEAVVIQLLRHISSTGSFSQFEFSNAKEVGDVLAESGLGKGASEFDSLWSNI
jgi:cyclic-di-GMP-binding protein